jgi:hypothetical protein
VNEEAIMADNLQNRGAQDRARINVNEEWEVRHWTEALGVSKEELERAVQQVGPMAEAVREHLKRH